MQLGGILAILAFLASGWTSSAPWFVNIFWSQSGIPQTTFSMSFLFFSGQYWDKSVTFHRDFCGTTMSGSSSSSMCSEMADTLTGLQIAYALGAIFCLIGGILCFTKRFAAVPILAVALTFKLGALFGFFFRALPLLQQHLESVGSYAVTVSWNFSFLAIISLGGAVLTILALLVAASLAKGARREQYIAARTKAREPTAPTAVAPVGEQPAALQE